MSRDGRRDGDHRAVLRDTSLTFTPPHRTPVRWLPRHGEPFCILEWLSQAAVKALAFLPVYIAVVVTLTLLLYVFGVPFTDGR